MKFKVTVHKVQASEIVLEADSREQAVANAFNPENADKYQNESVSFSVIAETADE